VAVVNVVGEIFSERCDERFVVLCGVKFFRPEKLFLAVLPSALQHVDVEKRLELGWDIFQERKNSLVGMLIPESVEDEAFFGYEGVSVSWNPVSS
jgi:hypothetical protein